MVSLGTDIALVTVPALAARFVPDTRDRKSCIAETMVIAALLWADAAGWFHAVGAGGHAVAFAVVVYALCRTWVPRSPDGARSHLAPVLAMAIGGIAVPAGVAPTAAGTGAGSLIVAAYVALDHPAAGRLLALGWLLYVAAALGGA